MQPYRVTKWIFSLILALGASAIASIVTRHIYPQLDPLFLYSLASLTLLSSFTFLIIKGRTIDRITRGTQLVSSKEFNRRVRGDGVYIPNKIHYPFPLNLFLKTKIVNLSIPQENEFEHILMVGDSGSGKSALQHTLLYQIAQRTGERVLIYDPSLEFWEKHGNLSRGDVLLHPGSELCPHWSIPDEVRSQIDATALAKSLLPDQKEGERNWWDISPKLVLVRLLLKLKEINGCQETLLRWFTDTQMIHDVVENTHAAIVISKESPDQKNGVIGSLVTIADSLCLLPPDDGRPKFSFTNWVQNGKGWVFIGTSGAGERDALLPLISAWLDTGFNRLMEKKGGTPTWCFVDELASLQRLPKLATATYEGRKYGMKFVMGFQGRSQIENLYGKQSEAILSMPGARIFLKTKESSAAEWIANNIGKPERERELESYSSALALTKQGNDSVSVRTDTRIDYLILPNEIQNLKKMHGYLRFDEVVVPISFPYPNPKDFVNPSSPSSAIRQMEAERNTGALLYLIMGSIIAVLLAYCYHLVYIANNNPHWLIKLTLLVLIGIVARLFSSESKNASNAKQGADGEEIIFRLLVENLADRGWKFRFNEMIGKNWDVDVIAIAPSGRVFVIDVKSHKGTKVVTNNGLHRRYGSQNYEFNKCFLKSVKAQAAKVAKQLNRNWVTPVICFANGEIEYQDNVLDPQGVIVLGGQDLIEDLEAIEHSFARTKLAC
ncbi:conserved membrane hypothetical protein [Hyella patelloides LEGE 07179]|uniref:Uncharacterized protein n=1 Tax=Hyella patelloides LEGE 07179 TaxID=945734 RepID=A0A563W276_9CYAN|nr:type IV secretion system DNA-binding domain-containing protein [Hyella patelloides]VEP17776.1 conserved membrane hypothetical protein [Hyella patelloides LEGE 07179]